MLELDKYTIKRFPKIFNLGDRHLAQLFEDEVFVEVKLDGSQFIFSNVNGNLHMRSKGRVIYAESVDGMFQKGVEHIKFLHETHQISEGIEFYCEYMQKPKHNTLAYERIPQNHFMLFGAKDLKTDLMIYDREHLECLANTMSIDLVHVLYHGKIETVDQLEKYIGKQSVYGGCIEEGIVIKNYSKEVMIGSEILPLVCGKYVRQEFREKNGARQVRDYSKKGGIEFIKSKYKTEARWLKSVQSLRENGNLTESVKDIGPIMKNVNLDIIEEEKENIKDDLWNLYGKDIVRAATYGLPDWWKEQLLKKQFE